jgi:hypothetical protein
MGQNALGLGVKMVPDRKGQIPELDDSDQERVVGIFVKGKEDYGDEFVKSLMDDMKELGYPILEIHAGTPDNVAIMLKSGPQPFTLPGQVMAIGVKEEGIDGFVYQPSMSSGMFRALSVLTQVNYSQFSNRAHCVIIDDIGEGLDFDRSAQLIDLLRRKAKASNFQLIMATNDKFVMNHVPLDEWSILQRQGSRVLIRNIHNSKAVFEDFKFVGMSNFAFFEMDFVNSHTDEDRRLILEGMNNDE